MDNEMKPRELYERLCTCAVFSGVWESPLFSAFAEYARAARPDARSRALAAMAGAVYESGLSFSELVLKLVLEDDNVYVRALARGQGVPAYLSDTARAELALLSDFATLTAGALAADIPCESYPAFPSARIDFVARYEERMGQLSRYGYGIFSSSGMFRLSDEGRLVPIRSADRISIAHFIGYEREREAVIANTEAFVEGRPAANVLLCGHAGTGKSSTVKAVANRFFDRGIRLIELRKDQLAALPYVMGEIRDNPLRFLIFIDDLSFQQNDDSFSMLKAALEGSASARAENARIYATSNRRHIVRESFGDREGGDVHRSDTMQEQLSLSERFGLVVHYEKPSKQLYLEIVHRLADRYGIALPTEELDTRAEAFALRRGNRSARCAEQFVESLAARTDTRREGE